jgi:hypothetical protein
LTAVLRKAATSAAAWWIVFAAALAAAVFLRCWQFGDQILIDDEWHAIQKLLYSDYAGIATHFGVADYSIPLTLYDRFLSLHGGLNEWRMRLPMLLSGVALIAVAPWLMRRHAPAATLATWSALLAISPIMVYHSRTARPYAITTLLVFIAVVAFFRWWQSRSRRWAGTYVACTFVSGWLHLITLPYLLMPFVFCAGAELTRGRQAWRDVARLLLLGIIVALPLAAALLPPLLNDMGALAAKSETGYVTVRSVYRASMLALGVHQALPFTALLALIGLGAWSWWRRDAVFVGYLVTIIAVAAGAVMLAHPAWVQNPGTFARYLQPSLPFLLMFAAEGAALLLSRLAAAAQAAIVVVAAAVLFLAGPMPGYLYWPNQLMGHPYFQADYNPAFNQYYTLLPTGPVPSFYHRLARLPAGSLTLVEAPWSIVSYQDPEQLYQAVHRQFAKIGMVAPECGMPPAYGQYPETHGMRLREVRHLSAILRGESKGADFLVMHLHAWPTYVPPPEWPDVRKCLPLVEAKLGPAVYRDRDMEVFALSAKAHVLAAAWH